MSAKGVLKPQAIISLVESLSHGDWIGLPDVHADGLGEVVKSQPNLVIAPMIAWHQVSVQPHCTGIAIGCFHAVQTSNRTMVAFGRLPAGSRMLSSTTASIPGVVWVEGFVIAVPSMRFSSHAYMARKEN